MASWSLSFSSTLNPWTIVLALFTLVFNVSPWRMKPVSPAVLIYAPEDALTPLLTSPLIVQTWLAAISRVGQLSWVATHSSSPRTGPNYLAGTYTSLLVVRCALGYFLSRSVGWTYPSLFSHTALYEPVIGLGPLLVGTLLFDDTREERQLFRRLALLAVFSAMDRIPWSYMCAALTVGVYLSLQLFREEKGLHGYTSLLPVWFNTTTGPENAGVAPAPQLSRRRIFAFSVLAFAVGGVFGNMPEMVHSMYASPPTKVPGVHVVMLTVPRTKNLSSDVMIDSISSYARPWLAQLSAGISSSSTLTVFAHRGEDGTHPAFDRAKAHFTLNPVPVTFYMQPSGPNGATMNHYVHLADAVQYAYEREREWTMFVEDDFALCGQWGWDNLSRVMARLGDPSLQRLNGAFIGTGGSGLIFHRSVLPALRRLLLLVAELDDEGASHPKMPPDVLLQACLSGQQSLCPASGWAISSRLLMGHRGWDVSTGDRVYTKDKWACGWRHPQHGMKGAEVVAV